jgi:hypothetical protein
LLHEVPDSVRRLVHSPGALLACSFAGTGLVSAGLAPGTAVSAGRDDPRSVARALAGCAVSPGQVVQWPAPRLRSAAVSARMREWGRVSTFDIQFSLGRIVPRSGQRRDRKNLRLTQPPYSALSQISKVNRAGAGGVAATGVLPTR